METQVMKLSDMRSVNELTRDLEWISGAHRGLKSPSGPIDRIEVISNRSVYVTVGSFGSGSAKALADAAVVLLERALEIEHGRLTEQLKALGVDPDAEKVQLSPSPSNTEGQ